ncbi:MAG: DNA helicase [Lapillicoccus sp.]
MSPAPFERDPARTPERVAAVSAALAQWRRQLTAVGGPNTLLWSVEPSEAALDLTTAHPGGVSMLLAGRPTRLSDLVRERAAFAEARVRSAEIRARSVELHAQRGLHTQFLVAGLATWDHPGAASAPLAPVLLRACSLRPTDVQASDYDVVLADEVEVNPVLAQYLRSAAHLDIDTVSLAEMSLIGQGLTRGFDPYPVYAALARLCAGLPGFTVTPRVLVGTYPHGKLAMVSDLADLARPEHTDRLAGHTVLAALSEAGEAGEAGDAGEAGKAGAPPTRPTAEVVEAPADVDPDPDPTGERLVLDADAAQGSVVEAVLRGRDVVVHAPPGTGTTQTVANLVAALGGQGSTVLLLSEHRSEIEDVRDRLAGVGLGGLLFDAADTLVDHRETLRRAAALLDPTPDAGSEADDRGRGRDRGMGRVAVDDRLRSERDTLRDHVAALHEVRVPWGVTMHEAQCAIAELGARTPPPASRVRIRGAALARLSRQRLDEMSTELTGAADRGAWAADEAGDPWYGARISTPQDAARAQEIVDRLAGGEFDAQAALLDEILAESSLPPARTVDDWRTALATMSGVRDTLEVFRPEIFDIPLDEHVAATGSREYRTQHGIELSAWNRSRVRRLATRLLRPGRPPQDLHAELIRARTERTAWHALVGAGGRPEISPRLDEAQETYDRLDADLTWLGERLAPTAAGEDLHRTPVAGLRERLAALAGRPERLAVLPQVVPVIDELRAAGMGEVVDDFADRGVRAQEVTPELAHLWWVSIAQHVADSDRRYGHHDGTGLRQAAHDFAHADRDHLRVTAERVSREVASRREEAARSSRHHVTTLRGEAEKRGRPSALRPVFEASHDLLLGLAPCWAMSPLLVGETLPPGSWFDVVVVVGAGSTTTATVVSGLSRGRQVVVVGDPHVGGPRPFAVGTGTSVADDEPVEESLLDDLAGLLPVHRLGWAHAYADERLVALASRSAYAGALTTIPHPVLAAPLSLELVDGRAAVEPGHESTIDSTDAEVHRVVDLVLQHARTCPHETLAVVTLTERHAERIRSALAETVSGLEAPADEEALRFLEIENRRPVQVVAMGSAVGLARDAVILAVGYGRTTYGRVLYRFPALSAPGADRSLATALTAARRRLTVVSSIAPDDLDPERLRDGGLVLRDLLLLAAPQAPESGQPDGAAAAGPPDPLLTDLGMRLRREELVVAERYGIGPRTVDLAVTDRHASGRWLVAVEGDGPAYAAWPGTRERDRLWPQELERRGWTHLRIWSTDLYRDPVREVARVIAVVREAAHTAAEPEAEPQEPTSERRRGPRRASSGPTGPVDGSAPAAPVIDPTPDDTDAGWGEPGDGDQHERWLQEQRPPHWD